MSETVTQDSQPAGCGPLLTIDSRTAIPLRQQVFEHIRATGRAARTVA